MTELPKTFDPAEIEARWYAHWEDNGLFRPDRPGAEPWTIVNPPPNVTGSLHIGHALDNTLQDILTRHARLKGKDARWVVGTDHAGIATQMVVERNLASQGVKRADMTRDQFIEHVQEWKAQSGGAITRQLRRLGCSMDWANERFTMDEGLTRATLKVFVDLYNEGLLYRDKRLVNWDPALRTAISDLEVEQREVKGHFWHFRYPLEGGDGFIAIATTRPETILGDGAVAVNPKDERYAHLVGKRCRLPIVDRLIPIITDDSVRIDFGSGAVKITAAHDWNDYEVAKRHPEANIPLINLMNADATMSDNTPPEYRGLDRYEARKKVVAAFDALGLLDKVEDHTHMVPYGDRSGAVIEPWLTDQWYVDAATLAKPAIEAVRQGRIRIVPKTWEKTFFNWMENIQPWCVSRQLWWGHRIPAWYGPELHNDGFVDAWGSKDLAHSNVPDIAVAKRAFVADSEAEAIKQAKLYYPVTDVVAGEKMGFEGEWPNGTLTLQRDPDVLDTWFSSALWPFATLGWPDPPRDGEVAARSADGGGSELADRPDLSPLHHASHGPPPRAGEDLTLNGRYPNDVLISGFDILFFWDARMMMQGLHFMGDVPFRTLYLHGLVRAADGQKMSKSKGNTVDPLGLIDRYGADALRFFMAAMESQGRDIKMDEKRVEGYRNFATKLWNAARFCQANKIAGSATLKPPVAINRFDRWILSECAMMVQAVDLALAEYRFDDAAHAIYHFVWDEFCDGYLEYIKNPTLIATESGLKPGPIATPTKAVTGWVLDQVLVVLHPFMPFITEHLWHALADRERDLIVSHWPTVDVSMIDDDAIREVRWFGKLLNEIRSARAELGIMPNVRLPLANSAPTALASTIIGTNTATLQRMGRVGEVQLGSSVEGARISLVVGDDQFEMPIAGVVDVDGERARLAKSIAAAEKERDSLAARLGNSSFVERAKPEAVEKARADHADKAAEAERLAAALGRLG